MDFSDPQGGKGSADRLAATCKSHIRIYINEGHNVTKAEEMQEALLSHGGVSGVRVAVLYTVPEIILEQKIPGISKLHNFEFGDGALAGVRHWFRKAFCGRKKYRSALVLFFTRILESWYSGNEGAYQNYYTYDEIKFLKGTFIILCVKYIYMPGNVIYSESVFSVFIYSFRFKFKQQFQQGERNWMEPQSYLVISITYPLPVYL